MTKTKIQSRGFWAVPLAILIAAVTPVCVMSRETSAGVGDTPVVGASLAIPASVCCARFICPVDGSVRTVWCKGGGTSIGDAARRCQDSCGEACDSTGLICTR